MQFKLSKPEEQVGLLGIQDQFVSLFEEGMGVELGPFGDQLTITGEAEAVHQTEAVLGELVKLLDQQIKVSSTDIVSAMKMAKKGTLEYSKHLVNGSMFMRLNIGMWLSGLDRPERGKPT